VATVFVTVTSRKIIVIIIIIILIALGTQFPKAKKLSKLFKKIKL